MKITESAKKVFKQYLEENKGTIIEIKIAFSSNGCGNKSIQLNLVKEDEATRVIDCDGINMAISSEDEKELEKVVFDCENGKVVLKKESCSCSGSDGSCCCGENNSSCHCNK